MTTLKLHKRNKSEKNRTGIRKNKAYRPILTGGCTDSSFADY